MSGEAAAVMDALVKAAQQNDHDTRPPHRNWQRVPDNQVARLLAGALDELGIVPPDGSGQDAGDWEALYTEMQCCATSARPLGNGDRERAFLDVLAIMDRLHAPGGSGQEL